jgi:ubiquinone/menaquinone biosynthesis C-methylase UbiE
MNQPLHNPLPDDHYGENYLSFERWVSFVHQINALRGMDPKRVLEIGVGPGATGAMVEIAHPGCDYISVDLDPTLDSSIRGDVRRLPFDERTFDAAFCCQVLEHLPYDDFLTSLGEIRRVTRRRVVISLPDVRPFIYLRARPPASRRILPWLWRGISLPALPPRTHKFDAHGQHHWEIGKRGYPLRRVLSDIKSLGWSKVSHYRMIERNYWHFFLLDQD